MKNFKTSCCALLVFTRDLAPSLPPALQSTVFAFVCTSTMYFFVFIVCEKERRDESLLQVDAYALRVLVVVNCERLFAVTHCCFFPCLVRFFRQRKRTTSRKAD